MEQERYQRHEGLYGWDAGVQERLRESTVLIAGLGGLGGTVALYLAAAGVGHLKICDNDTVQWSNLNRQILYTEQDIGKPKVSQAAERLLLLNHNIVIETLSETIKESSISSFANQADLIIDCLDNFEGRMVLNSYAVRKPMPLIHAGVSGFNGQITSIIPPKTPCLECIYDAGPREEAPPILGTTAGILGTMQAMEAIKHLAGAGELLTNKLMIMDGESMSFYETRIEKNPECKVCGTY